MSEQTSTAAAVKKELLSRLGQDSELYVLISLCTREPYVVCDPETYDDQIYMFFTEEEAKAEAKKLAGEQIPVAVTRLNGKNMLLFFTGLYTMGANALVLTQGEERVTMQLEDVVKRRAKEDMPEGSVWVENPAFHLTAIYFAQTLRSPAKEDSGQRLKELNEEMAAHFKKGTFIFALHKEEKGVPLVRRNDGKLYQPAFTDILEFQRFNKEDKLRPVVVEAGNLPKVLPKEAEGLILNIMGVNIPLTVSRPAPQPGEAVSQEAPDQAADAKDREASEPEQNPEPETGSEEMQVGSDE